MHTAQTKTCSSNNGALSWLKRRIIYLTIQGHEEHEERLLHDFVSFVLRGLYFNINPNFQS